MQELEKQNKKQNKDALFLKAKQSAIKYLEKYYGPNPDDWGNKHIDAVVNLKDFPENNEQLKNVPASAKAIILKAHLKKLYPNAKFGVVKPHYGSLDVYFKGGEYPFGAEELHKIYVNAGNTDLQVDYFDYDLYLHFFDNVNGNQFIYKSVDDAIKDLDNMIQKKKLEGGVDYYDNQIQKLIAFVGVKA